MTDAFIFEDKKAAFLTLGCKLNFAETSTLGKALAEQGVRPVRPGEKADLCVVNTCSVTELADKKCRNAIRKLHKEHPDALMVVTGCYAQLKPEDIAQIEGVDIVLGADEKLDLISVLSHRAAQAGGGKTILTTPTKDIRKFQPGCSADDRTRHFLKVQDGCDYFCSYCTIPKARGRSRNGSIASLVRQAEGVAAEGGKEIVLTGVNIGDFGRSTGETFTDLLRALDEVEGIERYRIGSIEPNLLSDELIDFCASSKRIAPHFHMPLQSGSDDVLKLMRRRYDAALFRDRVEHIRRLLPHAFIGIDVIVGTRGERPEFFEDCFDFLQNAISFSRLHIFTYSERPGTQALQIPYIVDAREKQRRSRRLLDLSDRRLAEFYRSEEGCRRRVLWEDVCHEGLMQGFTENYVRVAAPYTVEAVGTVSDVVLGKMHPSGEYVLLSDNNL